jgi:hypothetical protein
MTIIDVGPGGAVALGFDDNVKLAFGDDGDSDSAIYFDATALVISLGDTDRLKYTASAFAFQEATTISTTTGSLMLDPSGNIDFANNIVIKIAALSGDDSADGLLIRGNKNVAAAAAVRCTIQSLDTGGNAFLATAYAEPTATETTPFWAQRADVTTPLIGTLDASFLTFKWDPADDSVTVYVNDGGTLRSVAIGTVT